MKNPTNFKLLLLVVGSLFFYSATVFSLALSSDLKYAEFDPKTEDTEVFKQKATAFLNVLSSHESGTTGHVNVSPREPLGEILTQLAGKERTNKLVLLIPGIKSRDIPPNIEFWIVQKGSEGPFPVLCGLCDCPVASVTGKAKLDGSETEITFTAEVTDSVKVIYNWTVTGAKIIRGQGSDKITVKPDLSSPVVVAELEWRGSEACGCMGTAVFTSKHGERELSNYLNK